MLPMLNCEKLCEIIVDRLDNISKQLDRIENNTASRLTLPPPNVRPGTPTPPLLGPAYRYVGDDVQQ